MKPAVLAGLAAGVAMPAYCVYLRYRRDMNAARARLAAVDRHVVSARWGVVEYAERGSGAPVLVVHGRKMTSLPLMKRVSAPLSAYPALDFSASNREAT